MPEFPGGSTAMHKFISDNMRYPQMEKDSNIQGKVVVGFMVDVNGSVTDVRLKKGISPGLDAEAIRIVSIMPPFIPGTRLGKNVTVRFMLPLLFKIDAK
jgi:protein TonB